MATKERKPMKSAGMIAAAVGVAFVIGSAGGAYAGHKIHAKDIAKGAVHAKQIADHAVIWKKLNASTQKKIKGLAKEGPQGEQGEQGPQGEQGEPGQDGVVGNILHNSHSVDAAPGQTFQVYASCAGGPDGDAPNGDAIGYIATGGGFTARSNDIHVWQSKFVPAGHGTESSAAWFVEGKNTGTSTVNVRAWVICVDAPNDTVTD